MKREYLHPCLIDIVMDKTMVWVCLVVKARLFLKLTSHSFLEGSKLRVYIQLVRRITKLIT